ncbi:MAG: hypothetical protein WCB49_08640 [Gammaproteobacteria bacterium]
MADIVDVHDVVLAPEEGHPAVRLAGVEQVVRHDAALLLGDGPVLDADEFAACSIRPCGEIARRVDVGIAGLQVFIGQPELVICSTAGHGC